MSEKRHPTRVHEVLGVATEERFTFSEYGDRKFWLSGSGLLYRVNDDGTSIPATQGALVFFINNPEQIIRHTRLTDEQVRHLKGLYLLGFRWIERDEHDALVAWENYDDKADVFQNDFLPLSYRSYQVLIVVPTRNAPLNIVQTLRDAGVEVDDG
jgi:hypothetical protein